MDDRPLNDDPTDLCPALESPRDPVLMEEAQGYAQWMADHNTQGGHVGWQQRSERIASKLGSHEYHEITAETWKRNSHGTFEIVWADLTSPPVNQSWKQSPGHWECAGKKHTAIGIGTAVGSNDICYGCLISMDK